MQTVMTMFVLTAALATALASITVWSPRRLRVKVAAIGIFVLFLPISYVSYADLLSKPKPVRLEFFQRGLKEATVLSARMVEGSAIYLWLQVADQTEPRYYAIPWDQDVAKELQEAMREAERNQGGMVMQLPFERTWDKDKPKFYALPQPKLPEKGGEEVPEGGPSKGPLMYKHPGMSA
jgi:hypothetical protein